MNEEIHPNEVRDWLAQLQAPGAETRNRIIAKMQSLGALRLFPILGRFLGDPDGEFRCLVAETAFRIDPAASVALLLPLLDDPEWEVRVEICGLLHDIADERTIPPLISRLEADPHPMVRNTAAYALGGIGSPVAIPALLKALDEDHEYDELGHSASGCAATALDNILHTHHTRLKLPNGLCTLQPSPRGLDTLKAEALELFRSL
ncbi:HEAT repeat domain-containing protein [Armatimonas sp.]|uniref:HEAT repeat domain-containing protein n=1 Tax=Armatimonas sp. TaxID=1872638 RepID=UPI00286B51D2|nr:HEAT repeat domain-containing protein [Armatimonas sp.]